MRVQLAISLDGFVAGSGQSRDNPLGVGGMHLREWVFKLEAWRKQHGLEGGEVNASNVVIAEGQSNVGDTVMGEKCSAADLVRETRTIPATAGGATTLPSTRRCSCAGISETAAELGGAVGIAAFGSMGWRSIAARWATTCLQVSVRRCRSRPGHTWRSTAPEAGAELPTRLAARRG